MHLCCCCCCQVAGLPTNLAFLQDLSAHPAFDQLDLDTGFIERHRKTLLGVESVQPAVAAVAAALWSKITVSGLQNLQVKVYHLRYMYLYGCLLRAFNLLWQKGQQHYGQNHAKWFKTVANTDLLS